MTDTKIDLSSWVRDTPEMRQRNASGPTPVILYVPVEDGLTPIRPESLTFRLFPDGKLRMEIGTSSGAVEVNFDNATVTQYLKRRR